MLNPTGPVNQNAPTTAGRKNRRGRENQDPHDGYRPGDRNVPSENYGPRGPRGNQHGNGRVHQNSGRWAETGAAAATGHLSGIAAAVAGQHRGIEDLRVLADMAMQEKGLSTDYPADALKQVQSIKAPADDPTVKDMRHLPWCSVDNDDFRNGHWVVTSKDLDQLTASEDLGNGYTKVYVAIADVDALMPKDSPADRQAQHNTTTVYTADKIYPMIDRHFSEDLTSLNPNQDRLAMITEMVVGPDGEVSKFEVYRGKVHSRTAGGYSACAQWLEGKSGPPEWLQSNDPAKQAELDKVAASLQDQSRVAQAIKGARKRNGSLELESQEAKARMEDGNVADLKLHEKSVATELIENLMVASNGCASRFLKSKGYPTLQRIVREPKFWDKIVDLAADYGARLPKKPDSAALEQFLEAQRARDPVRFPDLSLNVVKLLGRGEYVVQMPDEPPVGHFGLAVAEYSHSTAPNRRYPDVITQRLLKAALAGEPCPYTGEELNQLALRCTEMEAAAQKVERQIQKSAGAKLLATHIGETFKGVVSGANDKGTWVRIFKPPVEGKLERGGKARVGDMMTVRLTSVDIQKGFIDFARS